MKNPFDKYLINREPCILKFSVELLDGKVYSDNKISIKILFDISILWGLNMIESLDLNLYALNNRSNVAYDFNNIKPIEGAKFYIDKTRTGKSSITETTSGIYRVENTFSFDSPFFGSNFDFLGINIVMNSKSIDDETNIKKSIYNSAVPTLYLGIQTNE